MNMSTVGTRLDTLVVIIARTVRPIALFGTPNVSIVTPIALILMPIVPIGTPTKPAGTRIEAMVTWIAVAGTKTGAMDATIAPTGITSATNDATARACFVRLTPILTSIAGKVRSHGICLVAITNQGVRSRLRLG